MSAKRFGVKSDVKYKTLKGRITLQNESMNPS